MGNVAAAEAVFAFTDALPFARVGTARQEVKDKKSSSSSSFSDSDSFWITSDVGLTVAGAFGRVVTESSVSVVGSGKNENENDDDDDDLLSPLLTLSVRPVSTRVEGSSLLPGPLGRTRVPVGEALDAVAGFTGRILSNNSRSGSGSGGKEKTNSRSSSSCATALEITYLDERLRIGRTPRDGHLFVYARDEE